MEEERLSPEVRELMSQGFSRDQATILIHFAKQDGGRRLRELIGEELSRRAMASTDSQPTDEPKQ
jgi:hypothetical protein